MFFIIVKNSSNRPKEVVTVVEFISVLGESRPGSVIQTTGTVEFEDGLWIGNHLKAQNGLLRVRNIPGVQQGALHTLRFLRGQTEFQSARVHKAV